MRLMPGISQGPKLVSAVTPKMYGLFPPDAACSAASMAASHIFCPPWQCMVMREAPVFTPALTACATVLGMS